MAKAFWLSCYRKISDPSALATYAELAGPAIAAHGGKFLARGGRVAAFEAGIDERTVVVEFESFERAVEAYNSEAYQAAKKKLEGAVERDLRVVEALD